MVVIGRDGVQAMGVNKTPVRGTILSNRLLLGRRMVVLMQIRPVQVLDHAQGARADAWLEQVSVELSGRHSSFPR